VRLLAESGKPPPQVAAEPGAHVDQLRMWRNEHPAAGSADAPARQKAEAAELARLRRAVGRLGQEDGILERAAASFAREAIPSRGAASSPSGARASRSGCHAGSSALR
jgi:transposase-like protein